MQRYVLLILVIFLCSGLQAQTQISLQEAWQIALQHNLELRAQDQTIAASGKEISIQKSYRLPSLKISGGYQHVSELAKLQFPFRLPDVPPDLEVGVNDQYDLALQAQQLVFTGFRTTNLIRAAETREEADWQQRKARENNLKLQVGLLYYELQANRVRQDVLRQAIVRADDQLARLRNLYRQSQTAAFDTLEAANRKLELQTNLAELENGYQVLLIRFRNLLNSPEALDVRPEISRPDLSDLPALADLETAALSSRPELHQINTLQKAEHLRSKALKSAYFPQIAANASFHYARPGVDFFSTSWMDYYAFGVQMNWDIWNWKRDAGKVAQSQIAQKRLSIETERLRQEVIRQVREAYQSIKNADQRIRLREQLLAQEQERYRITRAQNEQGLATNLDLRAAEKALTQAELNLQEAHLIRNQQWLRLQFALGRIDGNEPSSTN